MTALQRSALILFSIWWGIFEWRYSLNFRFMAKQIMQTVMSVFHRVLSISLDLILVVFKLTISLWNSNNHTTVYLIMARIRMKPDNNDNDVTILVLKWQNKNDCQFLYIYISSLSISLASSLLTLLSWFSLSQPLLPMQSYHHHYLISLWKHQNGATELGSLKTSKIKEAQLKNIL